MMTTKTNGIQFGLMGVLIYMMMACTGNNKYASSAIFVVINDYTHKYAPNSQANVPIDLISKGEDGWQGTVRVQLIQEGKVLVEESKEAEVAKASESSLQISIKLPEAEGSYELVALITGHQGQAVKSRRLIEIEKPLELELP